jgi:hypothetical protein
MREMIRVIGVVALLLTAACAREQPVDESQARDTVVEEIGAPQPIESTETLEFSALDQPSLLAEATMHRAGAEGEEVSRIRPGESIVVSLRMKEVPEMLAAWVQWLDHEGQIRYEEQKSVPESGRVAFQADTTGWPEGAYSAEIYVAGNLSDIKEFEISSEE